MTPKYTPWADDPPAKTRKPFKESHLTLCMAAKGGLPCDHLLNDPPHGLMFSLPTYLYCGNKDLLTPTASRTKIRTVCLCTRNEYYRKNGAFVAPESCPIIDKHREIGKR